MKRIHVVCEGPTELIFVRDVLQPALPALHLIAFLPGKLIARSGAGRGGDIRYARVRDEFLRALKNDPTCYCTSHFDYYGLGKGFPAKDRPTGFDPESIARRIELAVDDDIAHAMGPQFKRERFRSYLAMHEFEALLFSAPDRLASGLGRSDLESELRAIRDSVPSPEHIDDDPETAPSRRLVALCPDYDKVIGGNVAALEVGLEAMKRECAHFRNWFEWLEALAQAA